MVLQLLFLVLAGIAIYHSPPSRSPWLPGCTFHDLSGLHCPGCGGTRAVYSLLHGHWLTALRCNLLFFIAFPALAWAWLQWLIDLWTGRVRPPKMLTNRMAWTIFWAIMGFWLLRNLPWFPFTLLAPPAVVG